MQRHDRWLSFDCYGTLVSWQRGFPMILERVAGPRSGELSNAYHRFEAQVEAGPYLPYKDVLASALRLAANDIGLSLAESDFDVLAEHWDEQPVFADVGPALREAQEAGWGLAALTNCDVDLFARTQRTLPVAFDVVVTAQKVRSYKPRLAHFEHFAELGVPRERWVHVACSYFHDIEPARALGINRIWIDRDATGEDSSAASHVQPDLRNLVRVADRLLQ